MDGGILIDKHTPAANNAAAIIVEQFAKLIAELFHHFADQRLQRIRITIQHNLQPAAAGRVI
jgi:hypothetical protein